MTQTIMSSREFNQDIAGAKRAAKDGLVIVTDRGEPAFVLMTHDVFRRLSGQGARTMVDMLRQPGSPERQGPHAPDALDLDKDFEPVTLGRGVIRPADLA